MFDRHRQQRKGYLTSASRDRFDSRQVSTDALTLRRLLPDRVDIERDNVSGRTESEPDRREIGMADIVRTVHVGVS